MGIFDWFKKGLGTTEKNKSNPDSTMVSRNMQGEPEWIVVAKFKPYSEYYKKAICPYCKVKLDKSPEKKKKCPHCSNYIMVKTNYLTKDKMLLTQDQNDELQAERTLIASFNNLIRLCDTGGISKEEFLQRKKLMLAKNPGYSDFDIIWGLLNESGIRCAKNNDWGLYRNTRSAMVQLLDEEKRYDKALDVSLELFYLDINGPNNCSGLNNMDLMIKRTPFDSKHSFLAPAHVSYLLEFMNILNLSIDDVEKKFKEINTKLSISIMPVPINKAWAILKNELMKHLNNHD